ncbi:response regulator [Candidatus Kaiserbacteria bacterium]|nr:response regulator [Candidatus Kaiserbacteria bacterium]
MWIRATLSPYLEREYVGRALIVLVACFVAAKLGQFLFLQFNTSPAIFWPQFGIALAAIYLGGYRMWLPVSLAVVFSLIGRESSVLPIFAKTFGQTLQPLAGAYALHYLKFDGALTRMRDVLSLFAVSIAATTIAPTVSLGIQWAVGAVSLPFILQWSRAWAGGLVSVLMLTPLITSWLAKRETLARERKFELALAATSLFAITYVISFTQYTQLIGFPLAYVLLATLTWFAIRFDPRYVTLALLATVAIPVAGALGSYVGPLTLGERLFQIELFGIFVAGIYLLVVALMEERRRASAHIKKNMEELQQALRRISEEDRAKNEFIATLAHELRNPLSPVMSALEVLRTKPHDAEIVRLIDTSLLQTQTMKRLLEDLLDMARVANKTFKLKKEVLDLSPVIERSVESLDEKIRERRQMLSISLPAEQILLDADAVRLEQMLVNILGNAVKYTPEGGHITLSSVVVEDFVEIRVCDDGIGISETDMPHIWKSFHRSSESAELHTGLGIGLSLTKRLVEMHGGSVHAESEGLQKGSTFTLRLPRGSIALPMQESTTVRHKGRSFKILVVDDNRAAADGMHTLLTIKGHVVERAYSGEDALRIASDFLPEVILLDIGLPDIDGYTIAQEIRKNGSATLVALTGYGQEEDKLKAAQAGFDHHLVKPVGIAELEAIFSNLGTKTRSRNKVPMAA